jgi:hypothetical protein
MHDCNIKDFVLIEKLNFHEQFCENWMASTPREFTSQTLMLMVTPRLPSVVLREMFPGFSRKQEAKDY